MTYLDKLAPIGVLVILAIFLLFLLGRALRERRKEEKALAALDFGPPAVTMPVAAPMVPAAAELAEPTLSAAPVETVVPSPKRKPVRQTHGKTPIEGVVGLLQDKDALAKAFLLREILGPPVSVKR